MNIPEIFKRLGLSKHAGAVYHYLGEHGPLLATHIISGTEVHRPAVYRALDSLKEHRFITLLHEGKRKYYRAASVDIIVKEFASVSIHTEKVAEKVRAHHERHIPYGMRLFTGHTGIRAVFDDVIEHTPFKGTFYRYTSERNLDTVNAYLSPDYRARRDAKKLERQVISNPESGSLKRSRLERFIKFIPSTTELFDQNIIQFVYGDRIAFIDLNKEQALIIENKALADFQKIIFRQLYKKL